MPTAYPGALWDKNVQDTSNDGPEDATIAQAGDYNEMADEVDAIETELGYGAGTATPKGSKTSLTARLAVSINSDGSMLNQNVPLTTPTAITAAMNCGVITDVGGAGAPSTRIGTLPASVPVLRYLVVVTANGVRIKAPAGVSIQLGATTSALAGYVESTDLGANLEIINVSATLWVCCGINGIWNVDGA